MSFPVRLTMILLCWLVLRAPCYAVNPPGDVTIGLLAALSGDVVTLGNDCRDGYEVGRRLYAPASTAGAHKLRFLYGDTQGVGGPAVSEFNRLVNLEGAVAILGHRSQALLPINPLSKRTAVPLLGVLGHSEFLTDNPHAYRFWPSTAVEAARLFDYVADNHYKRIAVVSIPDEYTDSLKRHFVSAFRKWGGELALDIELQPLEMDFNTVLTRIKNSQPQVVFVNLALNQIGVFVRKMREHSLPQAIFTNVWAMSSAFMESAGPQAAEGVMFAQVDTNKPGFLNALHAYRENAVASAATYCCYTAITALLQALDGVSERITPELTGRRLASLTQINLLDETLEMRDHEAMFPMVFKTFRSGKLESF